MAIKAAVSQRERKREREINEEKTTQRSGAQAKFHTSCFCHVTSHKQKLVKTSKN